MKVLFVCDGYKPSPQAAGYCVFQVINYLQQNNVICDVINITKDPHYTDTVVDQSSKIINIVDDYNADVSELKGVSIYRTLQIVISKISEHFNQYKIKSSKCKKIVKLLNQIGNQYDVIIPVVADFNNGYAVMNYCSRTHVPYFLYQVDPIGTNLTQIKYKDRLQEFEKKLYEGASLIFTTPILKNEKINDTDYNMEKIISAEFPNVTDLCSGKKTSSGKVICSFCGNLINGVRDCSYILELFSMIYNPDIVLQFAGAGQEEIIRKYSEGKLKDRIIHRGKLSKSECISFMQNSDFLINIGNAMTNQVPSKIFDYISTGLPIINICKNSNCSTLPYLNKYSLSLNLMETFDTTLKTEQAGMLLNFINNNFGKRICFDSIKETFNKNTPEYVGNQFLKALTQEETTGWAGRNIL